MDNAGSLEGQGSYVELAMLARALPDLAAVSIWTLNNDDSDYQLKLAFDTGSRRTVASHPSLGGVLNVLHCIPDHRHSNLKRAGTPNHFELLV